jgi:hypothetical protein
VGKQANARLRSESPTTESISFMLTAPFVE